jgi:protoheme IX farnesyltransferase
VRSDYGDAGVPMLTETHGRPVTRRHIFFYTVFLVPVALGLGFTSIGGPVYLAAAFVLNLRFLYGAWLVWLRDDAAAEADNYAAEKWLFRISLSYLFLHFGLLLVEAALHSFGWSMW